jgi:indolepyruvate ferredoxin oxidoreductase beta subunit
MKQDVILAGVGGQGILSIAYVIDHAALKQGLNLKQAEVHGMAQRGGAVQSHLRLSDKTIYSDLIPRGSADMVLSVEPLETLRYLDYLDPSGVVVTSSSPLVNIPDYPELEEILAAVRTVERNLIVDSADLARQVGNLKAQNMVMLGAASRYLAVETDNLRHYVSRLFEARGPELVELNHRAFDLGRTAALT